ncbi:MAG: ribulose-bisphosphate carboxylase small chain [bacterium]|nr:ribulose-bisphosphate carboxylase small chain [bacterium]
MRVTQGTFSFLPDLSDEQIRLQVAYALAQGWALAIESTDDAHPRNVYWEMWGQPMFDLHDADEVMAALRACRAAHPERYIKVNAFDATSGWQTVRLSFIAHRPPEEPSFALERQAGPGRTQRYGVRARTTEHPR